MAKKKQELTVEEKLAAALVKADEQPYKVPGNWVWTRLGSVTTIIGGGTPSSNVSEYYENGTIPWISPADLSNYSEVYISQGRKNITELGLNKSSARLLPPDTVMLSSRAPIGYVVIAENEIATNQGFKSFVPSNCYLPKYLYYYLKDSKELLESYASGTTFLELSGKNAALVEFPLPPLAEQQRIVDRIESLFDQLDQAKALIQEALDSFATRKAAILHQAFTGALTKKWREEHGVGLESWEEKPFKECTEFMQNGISKRSGKTGRKVVVLRLANINGNNIDENDLREILLDDKEFDKYKLEYDDILIVRVNGSVDNVGKLVRIVNASNWAFCDHLIKVRVNYQSILPSFLMYVSMTNEYKDFIKDNMVSSAGQNTISQKSIGELVISLPTLDEQQEIVRILDDLFEKEQAAQDLCDQIDQIDTIKKTILGKAFRGELRTNVAGEESAVELLKSCLKVK